MADNDRHDPEQSGRGGRRPGAGRPPKAEAERMIRITVTLPPAAVDYLTGLGEGNLSEGIRRAIESHSEAR